MISEHPKTIARVAIVLAFGALSACDGDDPDSPKNGEPVTVELLDLVGPQHRLKAKVRYHNLTDKSIQSVRATLHYLDDSGYELASAQWAQSEPDLLPGDGEAVRNVGTFVPVDTDAIVADVSFVAFSDGSHWSNR